jgi:hypothetical protein
MRTLITTVIIIALTGAASAQTQPTRPSAWVTPPSVVHTFETSPLARCYGSTFNPTSSCYSGNHFPYYSAVPLEPLGTLEKRQEVDTGKLDEQDVKQRMKDKGYDVTGLQKDSRGIWRGAAKLKDGRHVHVTLDLAGNIYSDLAPPVNIWIRDQ